MGQVVVGVDESDSAAQALRWAAIEAELRGWSVTAVMAWGHIDQHHADAGRGFDPNYGEREAAAALDGIVTRAIGGAADAIERLVVCDLPARAVLEASADADLLVVGARGMGGFKGLLLGSVSQQCLHHTAVPIAVVRGEAPAADDEQRVVVAVDGSDSGRRAVSWAVDAARVRSARLTVVNGWQRPYIGDTAARLDPAELENASRQVVAAALEGLDTSGLPAPVEQVSAEGGAATAILRTAGGADLIVMGSRGRGGFKSLLLGSVTAQVTQHADTTVVVIPPAA